MSNTLNKATVVASGLLVLFTCVCVWLVFQYVDREKQRDLLHWQQQLDVIIDAEKQGVEDWLQEPVLQLKALSNNPLVQIFYSEAQSFKSKEISDAQSGQLHHLKNLLNATLKTVDAFESKGSKNVGIALMDASGVMLATAAFPASNDKLEKLIKLAINNKKQIISTIYKNESGQARFAIVTPVSGVQAVSSNDYRGAVVAIVDPSASLFPMLKKQWIVAIKELSILLKQEGDEVVAMSPVPGRDELFYRQTMSNTASAMAFSMSAPGAFSLKKNAFNEDVLLTSRKISGTQWLLVKQINAVEALKESASHQQFILAILLLAVFVVVISFIAIWRHATSVRLQKTMDRLAARTELLNAVNDSIKDYIFLLDKDRKLVLVNEAVATFFSMSAKGLRGKNLSALLSKNNVTGLVGIAENGDVRNKELRLEINNRRYDYHVTAVALKHGEHKGEQLFVLHDITALKDAQGKHNRLMESIIQTIVGLTDVHDPHCASHSERTRVVSVAIAKALEIAPERISSLAMAAQLANIGKLYVPTELLTSDEPLTDEQALVLKQSNEHSVELLEGLDFEGDVIKFVKQKNECLDGSGYPKGISGDKLLLESRILAVANAFVAMSSARAYRAGMSVDKVMAALSEQVGQRYDEKVVEALLRVISEHKEWEDWQGVK